MFQSSHVGRSRSNIRHTAARNPRPCGGRDSRRASGAVSSWAAMSHCQALFRLTIWRREVSMKRSMVIVLAAVAACALFAGLLYGVLVAAHLSDPAAATVYGPTARRVWPTTAAMLALIGVVIGGLALGRPADRLGTASGRLGAILALVVGVIAAFNGGLNLAVASGGPG